jgi:uncharacterized membrane protein
MTAKQQRSIRQTEIQRPGQMNAQVEHTEVFDDNLLPEAVEIERLQRLDTDIMQWLKERAANEQEFRHTAYSRRLDIAESSGKREHHLNLLGIIFAFILMLVGFGVSAYLIFLNQIITGTIFSGATLVLIATTFITRRGIQKPAAKKP